MDWVPYYWDVFIKLYKSVSLTGYDQIDAALRSGRVPIRAQESRPKYGLPTTAWHRIESYMGADSKIEQSQFVLKTGVRNDGRPVWTAYSSVEIDLPSLENWLEENSPEIVPPTAPGRRSNTKQEKQLKRWLSKQPASPVRTKEEVRQKIDREEDGLDDLKGLGIRAFNRCWTDSAPDEWKAQGRRPKKSVISSATRT